MSLITEVDILDEAKDNFLTYAEEVLTDRAIPAAEDGLLSVMPLLVLLWQHLTSMAILPAMAFCGRWRRSSSCAILL